MRPDGVLAGRPRRHDRAAQAVRRALFCALAALVVALSAAAPPAARADGDPASDVLVTQSLFLPVEANLSDAQRATLTGFLNTAARAGFPIRVAVIPAAFDLGAVGEFWMKPQAYASFLGIELSLVYKGPLLVVMPDGFGINWPGHSTASVSRLLAKISVKPTGEGLLDTVQTATRTLASSAGARVSGTTISAASSGDDEGVEILIAVVVAVFILGGVGLILWRRSARAAGGSFSTGARTAVSALGWVAPGVVLVLALVVIVHALVGGGGHVRSAPKILENSPYIFPQQQKRAPNFLLRDQNGRPVSLAAFRGHPLILTFVDPGSAEADPRTVKILNDAETALPASERLPIVAVSVDVYADARANLLRDLDSWHLVPQWRLAVGSPAQLAAVWKSYYAVIDVITKPIAGATIHEISASKMAYLIDADGHERALFGWPYGAKEVERTVLELQRSHGAILP